MGMHRITIEANGNHGCHRHVKDGGTVYGCRAMDCVDCQARDFVAQLVRRGDSVSSATLEHWPNDEKPGPVDDLKTGVRAGSFSDYQQGAC